MLTFLVELLGLLALVERLHVVGGLCLTIAVLPSLLSVNETIRLFLAGRCLHPARLGLDLYTREFTFGNRHARATLEYLCQVCIFAPRPDVLLGQ